MDFTQLFEAAAQATAGGNQSLFASAIAAIPHIAFQQTLPGSPAQYSDIPDPLGTVKQALQATGIDRLYQHQAESYAALSKGKNVLLETPTASGKTLASVLYIMQQCQEGRTGLIVLPLRALAYDIFAKIQEINENLPTPLRISLHIGDISKAERDQDFKAGHPNLIIASPDVLHHLLYHKGRNGKRGVQAFFAKLGVIWLDEIHAYTSTFGANLAALCRRIYLAVEQLNSSNPRLQWICTTATIGNSLEHCSLLTGQNASTFHSIAQSTARVQERELVMIDPRYDVNKKAAAIAKILLDCDHKGLVFANSRNGVKSIYRYLSEKTSLAEPFYGSLSQEKRVELIEAFSQNRKRCLVSTSSLEAGVDLDSVEFVVLAGLTSLNSLWQRIGRAGRHLPGLIALVPDANNVVDYYYSRNPEKLFGKAEAIKISLDYPPVLSRQLRCVAAEGGIYSLQVRSYFGNIAPHLCRSLLRQNILNCSVDNRLWAGGYPHKDVNLRGSSARQFRLIDEKTGEELETLSEQYALREGYLGSIYSVSQNNKLVSYRCGNWQREDCVIPVEALAIDAEYRTTEPDAEFKIELMSEIAQPKTIPALEGGLLAQLHWGRYCQQVSGFEEFVYERSGKCGNRNCSLHGKPVKGRLECSQCRHQLIDRKEEKKSVASVSYEEPLTLEFEIPILQLKFTLELAEKIKAFVQSERAALEQQFPREEDRPEIYCLLNSGSPLKLAYHALLHAIKKPIPLILLASEKDIGEVVDCNLEVGFAFDAVPEGSGSVSALFGSLEEAIAKGWELLTTCECQSESGCPRCLSDRQCLDRNEPLIKYLGIWLLDQFVAS